MQKRRTPPQDVLSAADEAWLHNLLRSCQLLGRHGHSATPRRSENERSRKEIEAGNKEEGLPAKPPYRSCRSNEQPNRFPFSLGWIRCQCATESIVEYFESNGKRRKPPVSETQPKARRRGAGFFRTQSPLRTRAPVQKRVIYTSRRKDLEARIAYSARKTLKTRINRQTDIWTDDVTACLRICEITDSEASETRLRPYLSILPE